MKYNEKGEELPDPTPVALTVKQRVAVDKFLLAKQQILAAIERDKAFEGEETFEESLDFDVEDDDMPMTSYEKAELEVDDYKRTAAFVREQEYVAEGKKRFTKPTPSPAKPTRSRGGDDPSLGDDPAAERAGPQGPDLKA